MLFSQSSLFLSVFDSKRSEAPYSWIQGVVQPGGEKVETTGEYIAVNSFSRSEDPSHGEPLPEEIEVVGS
jgi:hypothetical protein